MFHNPLPLDDVLIWFGFDVVSQRRCSGQLHLADRAAFSSVVLSGTGQTGDQQEEQEEKCENAQSKTRLLSVCAHTRVRLSPFYLTVLVICSVVSVCVCVNMCVCVTGHSLLLPW